MKRCSLLYYVGVVEPGTPPTDSMFKVIKNFVDEGVCCAVNIGPIMPLITDGPPHLDEIVNACYDAGVKYVSGSILRLRLDIWERMKVILKLLKIENGIEIYKNTVYRFREPLKPWINVGANRWYETKVIRSLKEKILQKGLIFDFPDLIKNRSLNLNKNPSSGGQQALLMNYM